MQSIAKVIHIQTHALQRRFSRTDLQHVFLFFLAFKLIHHELARTYTYRFNICVYLCVCVCILTHPFQECTFSSFVLRTLKERFKNKYGFFSPYLFKLGKILSGNWGKSENIITDFQDLSPPLEQYPIIRLWWFL